MNDELAPSPRPPKDLAHRRAARWGTWLLFVALVAGAGAACFGDNGSEASSGALTMTVAEQADGGDVVEVQLVVRGVAGDQVSLVLDAPTGSFSPQTKVVVADEDGLASLTSQYQTDNRSAEVVLLASAVGPKGSEGRASKVLQTFETERVGNLVQVTSTITETAGYLIAYPLTVVTGRELRKFVIVAPEVATAAAEVHVGLYTNSDTNAPQNALVKVTAAIVPGVNSLPATAADLAPGKYWMVVAYRGTPTTFRGLAGNTVMGWNLSTFVFDQGLPNTMPVMTMSNLGQRNFSAVLRK